MQLSGEAFLNGYFLTKVVTNGFLNEHPDMREPIVKYFNTILSYLENNMKITVSPTVTVVSAPDVTGTLSPVEISTLDGLGTTISNKGDEFFNYYMGQMMAGMDIPADFLNDLLKPNMSAMLNELCNHICQNATVVVNNVGFTFEGQNRTSNLAVSGIIS